MEEGRRKMHPECRFNKPRELHSGRGVWITFINIDFTYDSQHLHAAFYVYYKDVQTAMKSRSDVRKDTKKRGEKQE